MIDQHATPPPAATPADAPAPDAPRIYVACLSAYNAGHLHGAWIETSDPHEVWTRARDMLAASPEPDASEWAIHDYENFCGCRISEWASFDAVCELADFIREHGELGGKLYAHHDEDLDAARSAFENYAGAHRSAAEFAEALHEETATPIPESLRYYIDWEALARDMELNGEIIVFRMGFDDVHIFWSR